jgi:hypothetical protein
MVNIHYIYMLESVAYCASTYSEHPAMLCVNSKFYCYIIGCLNIGGLGESCNFWYTSNVKQKTESYLFNIKAKFLTGNQCKLTIVRTEHQKNRKF